MSNILDEGLGWLAEQRKTHMSRQVIYRRGSESVSLRATVGQTVFRLQEQYGATIRITSRDYIVNAADLVINGTPVTPERGDRIEDLAGGIAAVYEVMAPGGEDDWAWLGGGEQAYRIHVKRVE